MGVLEATQFTGLPARRDQDRDVRVLYVIDSLWGMGGAELALLRLVKQLHGRGYQCAVVTFHTDEACRPFLAQFPCPVNHWPIDNIYGKKAMSVALKLIRQVRSDRPDIVHTFFQAADLWAAPLARLSGVPCAISSRRDMGILRSSKHRLAYRILSPLFHQVQAVSDSVREAAIASDRLAPADVVTIRNGIALGRSPDEEAVNEIRQRYGLSPEHLVLTCIANIRPVKGIDVLLAAFPALVAQFPTAKLLLVGGLGGNPSQYQYVAELREQAVRLGIENAVIFAGVSDNVPAFLAASDLFVLPSRSEGLSNALLEAMGSRLPCVATSVGGNPEVVIDGETGFLVPPDNPEKLAERLIRLAGDLPLRRRMGAAAFERIRDCFSEAAMAEKVCAAYEVVLRQRGALQARKELA